MFPSEGNDAGSTPAESTKMESVIKSKYSIAVVICWLFVSVYFFFFTSSPFSYFTFQINDLILFFPIAICAFASLFVANRFIHFGQIETSLGGLKQNFLIIFYALVLIAIPEEIIFRAYIQGNLHLFTSNIIAVIIISSFIFGIAHLPNGARGFRPREWNWKLAAMCFVAGLYLGLAYFLTNSLVEPVILHTLFAVVPKIFVKDY